MPAATGVAPAGGNGGAAAFNEADYPNVMRTPEDALLSRENQGRIWNAYQELSARQREVFALLYVEERSTEEVAQMLGITTGSVKRYLFRAVHHLRGVLGERS
jgi:RNA polymerase sigma factor (sigma-70 family)